MDTYKYIQMLLIHYQLCELLGEVGHLSFKATTTFPIALFSCVNSWSRCALGSFRNDSLSHFFSIKPDKSSRLNSDFRGGISGSGELGGVDFRLLSSCRISSKRSCDSRPGSPTSDDSMEIFGSEGKHSKIVNI
jgi:hypothetical protein